MEYSSVFSSEYVQILKANDEFYIQSFKKGMSIGNFNQVLNEHPEISITSFMAIKNALLFAPMEPVVFGKLRQRVLVEISGDELKAYITIYTTEQEFSGSNRTQIIKEVIERLREEGVVFGIKHDIILECIVPGQKILVAEGIPPENGKDSVINMYTLKEVKPEIKEDGKVDHYELSLINKVSQGEWIGERIDPTKGVPGKTVKGNTVLPMPGKKYPLLYDKSSVKEVYNNSVTTLYALREGAVYYEGERIGVSNHLEITNNVDFKTGNIDFDGYLTVKGSIEDNFAVVADNDVEILGEYGVGSVKEIVSKEGSVYIRGGIAGKNKAIVKSKKDIYTKFASDAEIICEGSVHIGFYCLNSNIKAKEVILDSPKGQIMGGNIEAEIKVVSSIIGTPAEKRTMVSVKGFDREALKQKLVKVMEKLELLKEDLIKNKQELSIYSYSMQLNDEQLKIFELLKDRYYDLRSEIKLLEDEKKTLVGYLRTHGEGEVSIIKKVYPNTMLAIKRIMREIDKTLIGTSFYVKDGQMKQM